MNASNKWTLKAEEARSELITIKGNYHGSLTEIPYQRMSAVPTILFHAKAIEESYQELSFILPDKNFFLRSSKRINGVKFLDRIFGQWLATTIMS